MFTFEEGSELIINKSIDKYEKYFETDFPLYNHLEMTRNDTFDFSIEGSKKLADFIDKCIKENKPVTIPDGYEDRVY